MEELVEMTVGRGKSAKLWKKDRETGEVRIIGEQELPSDSAFVIWPNWVSDVGVIPIAEQLIRIYVDQCVALSNDDAQIVTSYVLTTWLYDRLDQIPYLNFSGAAGTGKSMALKRIGAICYRGMLSTGNETAKTLLSFIDRYRGTLLIDEGDLDSCNRSEELSLIIPKIIASRKPIKIPGAEVIPIRMESVRLEYLSRMRIPYCSGEGEKALEEQARILRCDLLRWRMENWDNNEVVQKIRKSWWLRQQ